MDLIKVVNQVNSNKEYRMNSWKSRRLKGVQKRKRLVILILIMISH